jgi:hypothetical protein
MFDQDLAGPGIRAHGLFPSIIAPLLRYFLAAKSPIANL